MFYINPNHFPTQSETILEMLNIKDTKVLSILLCLRISKEDKNAYRYKLF